jgi:hypothetical protein
VKHLVLRVLTVVCIFGATAFAQNLRPIKVIIIGVPSNGVSAYATSTLGDDITAACNKLEKFFTSKSVEIVKLCDLETTKSGFVHASLNKYFGGQQRGQLNLVFVMAHGEATGNKDVRLLLSDATDDAKDDHSLILGRELSSLIAHADDSVTVAFVDACYSAKAAGLRLESLGEAARQEGAHVGLLVSSQADEQSYAVGFTNAVLDIWQKNACPHNSDEFNSELLKRMDPQKNSPEWLIRFNDSLCIDELLNPKMRVISIWRDPEHLAPFQIRVFNDKDSKKKAIVTINQDRKVFSNPYLTSQIPGRYRIETYGPTTDPGKPQGKNFELLDKRTCDFAAEVYCKYEFPHTTIASAESLGIQEQIYRTAVAHGYPDTDLKKISDDTGKIYAGLILSNPQEAISQARALRWSDPSLWQAMLGSPALDQYSQESWLVALETQRSIQQDISSLKDRLAQNEKANTDLLGDLKVVTDKLTITQAQLKKARTEAAQLNTETTEKLTALDTSVHSGLADVASSDDVKTLDTKVSTLSDNLAKTNVDLNMARSELGTLIARNHDEIDVLRRLNERDYIEFTVTTGRGSQQVGPLQLELLQVNLKEAEFTVRIISDGSASVKKNRPIQEPIFLYPPGYRQPLELVVNKISENNVGGYLSIPKNGVRPATR